METYTTHYITLIHANNTCLRKHTDATWRQNINRKLLQEIGKRGLLPVRLIQRIYFDYSYHYSFSIAKIKYFPSVIIFSLVRQPGKFYVHLESDVFFWIFWQDLLYWHTLVQHCLPLPSVLMVWTIYSCFIFLNFLTGVNASQWHFICT